MVWIVGSNNPRRAQSHHAIRCRRAMAVFCVIFVGAWWSSMKMFWSLSSSFADTTNLPTIRVHAHTVIKQSHDPFAPLSQTLEQYIRTIEADVPACRGKSTFIRHLVSSQDKRYETITEEMCRRLRSPGDISRHYGETPIIVGIETCASYRELLARQNKEAQPRIAGLYHSGTNAMAMFLQANLQALEPVGASMKKGYDVPWGKHLLPDTYRETNLHPTDRPKPDLEAIMPVILVRDPYTWMQAMCKAPYDARWHKLRDNRCPNLWNDSNSTTYELAVRTHQTQFRKVDHYASLADMWTQFNQQYYNATYPRLMVRYEDVMTHPEQIVGTIRDCIGLKKPSTDPFQYVLETAKKHGKPSDYFQSLQKLATDVDRHRGMTKADRVYSNKALHTVLMKTFRYNYAPLQVFPRDLEEPFPELGQPSFLKTKTLGKIEQLPRRV